VQQGSKEDNAVPPDTPVPHWTSVILCTESSFREHVFGLGKFSSAPVTPVAWNQSTGAFTLAMIRDSALEIEETL